VVVCTLAIFVVAHAQDQVEGEQERLPKIRARFNATGRPEAGAFMYEEGAGAVAFDVLFEGGIYLQVENAGEDDVDVTWQVFVNNRCVPDDAVALANSADETVEAGGAQINVATLQFDQDDVVQCGPVCVFANLTADGMMHTVARIAFQKKCVQELVDLQVEHDSFDTDVSHEVEWGLPLLEQLPGLEGLLLKNNGEDMKGRSADLADSVLAFIRIEPFDQSDVDEVWDPMCWDEWDEDFYDDYMDGYGDSGAGDDMNGGFGRKKRSLASQDRVKRELHSRKKRYTSMTSEVEQLWDEINAKLPERQKGDAPTCVDQRFVNSDMPLIGGDIMVDALDGGGEAEIDLSNVKLQTKINPCIYFHGLTEIGVQLIISPDPLGMYNDTDHCNDAIIVNITMECPDEAHQGWQAAQCQLLVDPLSRGHSAVVNYYTTPHLKYNGQRMELLYENKCDRDFNHYMDKTDLIRFKLLADRYQRQVDRNPQLCADVEEQEASDEREMFQKSEDEGGPRGNRKKRQIGGGGGQQGGGQQGGGQQAGGQLLSNQTASMTKLREFLDDVGDKINNANLTYALRLVCTYDKLILLVESLELEDGHPLLVRWEKAGEDLDEMKNDHDEAATINEVDCDEYSLDGLDDLPNETDFIKAEVDKIANSDDDVRSGPLKEAFEDFMGEQEEMGDIWDMDFEDRFTTALEMYGELENNTCPAERGKAIGSQGSRNAQIISLVNKGVNAKSSDAEYEELPQGSCGMRRVTQMLRNGGGKYLNKDILKFSGGVRRNAQDDMVDKVRFARAMNESLHETDDVDELRMLVEEKMNETAERELERCGMGMAAAAKFYQADNNYDVYWQVKGGKIYMGMRDILADDFGKADGAKRMLLWRQMASCTCDQCNTGYDPDFYSMMFDRYGPYGGSTTTESGDE